MWVGQVSSSNHRVQQEGFEAQSDKGDNSSHCSPSNVEEDEDKFLSFLFLHAEFPFFLHLFFSILHSLITLYFSLPDLDHSYF